MAIAVLPILVGMHGLYEWSHPELVDPNSEHYDRVLDHKSVYLNPTFFVVRTAIYFAVWMGLAWLTMRITSKFEARGDLRTRLRQRRFSGPGIAAYVLTMTFAAFDWGMSLEPHWFSTVYGVLFIVGQGLATFCLCVIVLKGTVADPAVKDRVGVGAFHDLGNLMFAFTMLWAYISFSQFLIIWSGNLPEETPWYLARMRDSWQPLAQALLVAHFVLPFLVLLQTRVKRNIGLLSKVAMWLLVMRFFDIVWLIAPGFQHGGDDHGFRLVWQDAAAMVGIGGVWLWLFHSKLARRAVPPLSAEALHEHHGHGETAVKA
jgi:hypothetical protein